MHPISIMDALQEGQTNAHAPIREYIKSRVEEFTSCIDSASIQDINRHRDALVTNWAHAQRRLVDVKHAMWKDDANAEEEQIRFAAWYLEKDIMRAQMREVAEMTVALGHSNYKAVEALNFM